jgi:hypothetical protein
MTTVDHSPRDANGNIIHSNKVATIGGGSFVGSRIGALMAMAGSALPVLSAPERIHPPKEYRPNTRHQGEKECARRLRQLKREVTP